MKKTIPVVWLAVVLMGPGLRSASGQSYAIDWHTLGSGGGTSTGGVYSVSATIGDVAAGQMSGGGYVMDAGFWSDAGDLELIVNGSFENLSNTFVADIYGLMSQPAGSTAIPGWTTTTAELAWVNNTNTFGAATPFGAYALELTGYHDSPPYAGVQQTIVTTPGQKYRLALALGSNADYPGAGGQKSVSVCVGPASTTFTLIPTNTTGNLWSNFSFSFTANSTSTVVQLRGIVPGGGVYLGVDNLSVTPDFSPSAPPTGELVVNGSFENTDCLFVPDGNHEQSLPVGSTAIPGWTVTDAELVWGINGNAFGPQTVFGAFFVDLTGYHDSPPYAGLSQILATTPGEHYRLTFSLGADEDVSAYRGPMSVGVMVGDVTNVFTFTPPMGTTGDLWMSFSYDFTAAGDSTPLAFVGTASGGGAYLGLDNVSVVATTPAFRITAVNQLNGDLVLDFTTISGKSYVVQSRADLESGDWDTLLWSTNSGTGGTIQTTVTNAFTAPQQLYRIWQLP